MLYNFVNVGWFGTIGQEETCWVTFRSYPFERIVNNTLDVYLRDEHCLGP